MEYSELGVTVASSIPCNHLSLGNLLYLTYETTTTTITNRNCTDYLSLKNYDVCRDRDAIELCLLQMASDVMRDACIKSGEKKKEKIEN